MFDDGTTNSTLHYYKSIVEEKGGDLYFALLVVNWTDDDVTEDAMIDFSAHGIALSSFDNCEMMNMWTQEKKQVKGGKNSLMTNGLPYHGHIAYKIKCSAF